VFVIVAVEALHVEQALGQPASLRGTPDTRLTGKLCLDGGK
jgi:hypothetical protein